MLRLKKRFLNLFEFSFLRVDVSRFTLGTALISYYLLRFIKFISNHREYIHSRNGDATIVEQNVPDFIIDFFFVKYSSGSFHDRGSYIVGSQLIILTVLISPIFFGMIFKKITALGVKVKIQEIYLNRFTKFLLMALIIFIVFAGFNIYLLLIMLLPAVAGMIINKNMDLNYHFSRKEIITKIFVRGLILSFIIFILMNISNQQTSLSDITKNVFNSRYPL